MTSHHRSAAFLLASLSVATVAFAQAGPSTGRTLLDRNKTKLPPPAASAPTSTTTRPATPVQGVGRSVSAAQYAQMLRQQQPRLDDVLRQGSLTDGLQRMAKLEPGMREIELPHHDEKVQLGPRLGVASISKSERLADAIARSQRDNRRPPSQEEIAAIAAKPDPTPANDQALRNEFAKQGYEEVKLRSGGSIMVRGADGCARMEVAQIIEQNEGYRWGIDPNAAWISDCVGCWDKDRGHHSNAIVDSGFGGVDPFVTGTAKEASKPNPTEWAKPAEPLTDIEAAAQALFNGAYDTAAARFRQHLLQFPDDAKAHRALAVTLAVEGANKRTEAAEMFGRAYELDPKLGTVPVQPESISGGADTVRRAVQSMVEYAHRTKDSRAWLAVAVLMQAEGRNENALKILPRAAADPVLPEHVAPLRTALKDGTAPASRQ